MAFPRRDPIEQIQDDFTEVLYGLQKDTKGFVELAGQLKKLAGINLPLNDKNLSLMAGRLISMMRKYQLTNYKDYIALLRQSGPEMVAEFISRMTTNTTEFFREDSHFNFLRSLIVPYMAQKVSTGSKELRVWCAACSSGQEAYTLLMTLLESRPAGVDWNIKLLATDIDTEILERAMEGVYTKDELKNVSPIMKQKYFNVIPGKTDKLYKVNTDMRNLAQFASFNLMTEPYPFKHPFDVIFCRNVFIYFDRDTQTSIMNKMSLALAKGGHLFLGHSESGMVKSNQLKTISHAVYQRV